MNFQNRTAVNQQNQKSSETMLYLVPQHVSVVENPVDETSAQIIGRQEKFIRLEKRMRYKLASFDTGQKIQAIGQKYGFELLRLANITRLIRGYYFGEVRFENFPTEIEKRMGVSLLTAQEITRYIKTEIIDWDPWAEYLAKLPKLPIREISQRFPKIADTVITAGYIELKNSEELENPTIKNWLKDYISHLGYERHSQMDRAQYLFHSENGKDLNSQDREKLGIILKSFDENIPLPVDEGNGEIVFDGMMGEPSRTPPKAGSEAAKQKSFIRPYAPMPQSQRQTSRPAPVQTVPPQNLTKPAPISQSSKEFVHPNIATQPNRQVNPPSHIASQADKEEINKFFSAPESPEFPPIKIHSITEYNEPKIAQQVPPRQNIQRSVFPKPISALPQPEQASRPKHKIINPFFSKPMPEPRLDGNIVDLSEQ
ncbi:MAG: hypothetical protein NT093_03035 [Candidatus Moranbacteria bacterium]|nr:hypothetical protein [Candidatus Moranbacteria bacterium]